MRTLIAGSRLYAVDQSVATRRFFLRWLSLIDSNSPPLELRQCLQDADEWLRRHRKRRAPISHSNWNDYSGSREIPLRNEEPGPPRIVSRGAREKEKIHYSPNYPETGRVGTVPLTGSSSDGSLTFTDRISYGIGDVASFHECSHSWERGITEYRPTMGLIPSSVRVNVDGWASRTRAKETSYDVLAFSPVRTQGWTTRELRPSQAQVAEARRYALASMYGGNPTTKPNFLRALIELKDTRQTVQGLVHFYKWGRSLMSHGCLWEKAGSTLRRVKVARATLAEIAGAYLNYVFGLKPTVDDVLTFVKHVTNLGLKSFIPQGKEARPGLVIVSNYTVHPDGYKGGWSNAWAWRLWDIEGVGENAHAEAVHAGTGGPNLSQWYNQDCLETVVRGCVFARIKRDNSEYFWNHFGEIGYTWSWPPILTAWEVLPWSWLVDWFSNTKSSIRLAEREARTYWMRCGFEDPWYAERHDTYRHTHTVTLRHETTSDLKRVWITNRRWRVQVRLWSYWDVTNGPSFLLSRKFERHPLSSGFPNVETSGSRITVRAFQISVGMALVLNT